MRALAARAVWGETSSTASPTRGTESGMGQFQRVHCSTQGKRSGFVLYLVAEYTQRTEWRRRLGKLLFAVAARRRDTYHRRGGERSSLRSQTWAHSDFVPADFATLIRFGLSRR